MTEDEPADSPVRFGAGRLPIAASTGGGSFRVAFAAIALAVSNGPMIDLPRSVATK